MNALQGVRSKVAVIRKAVAAAVAALVVAGFGRFVPGLDEGAVAAVVDAAIIAFAVWAVPNAKGVVDSDPPSDEDLAGLMAMTGGDHV